MEKSPHNTMLMALSHCPWWTFLVLNVSDWHCLCCEEEEDVAVRHPTFLHVKNCAHAKLGQTPVVEHGCLVCSLHEVQGSNPGGVRRALDLKIGAQPQTSPHHLIPCLFAAGAAGQEIGLAGSHIMDFDMADSLLNDLQASKAQQDPRLFSYLDAASGLLSTGKGVDAALASTKVVLACRVGLVWMQRTLSCKGLGVEAALAKPQTVFACCVGMVSDAAEHCPAMVRCRSSTSKHLRNALMCCVGMVYMHQCAALQWRGRGSSTDAHVSTVLACCVRMVQMQP
eukprot:1161864-Pelagomonas_calceolata.AAC.14